MEIPIEKLRRCPIQLRTVIKESLGYISTRDSIKDLGILTPLLVRAVEDYYEVINGAHRHEIGLDLRFETLPCHVRQLSDEQVRIAQVAAHTNIVETDRAAYARRLWQIVKVDKSMTLYQLAAKMRWHPDEVKRTMSLVYLCPRAQRDLERGDLSLLVAENLCKLPVGRQDSLMDLIGTMPEKEYRELVCSEARQHRQGRRDGRTQQDFRFRPIREVKSEYLDPSIAASVILDAGATTPLEGFQAALSWVLKKDSASQAEAQRLLERKAAKEAARFQKRTDP
ncbi:MAG: ParB/RepB/Spo0J family partition protein [Planctomycetota bacterium]